MIDRKQISITTQGAIHLGKQGENEITEVIFPQSAVLMDENWTLLHRRAVDREGYPVPLEKRDNTLVWLVTAGDTAFAGTGEAELTCISQEGQVLKTKIYHTSVIKSLPDGGRVPDVVMPWYQSLLNQLRGVVRSVNGVCPNADGNVEIEGTAISEETISDAVASYLKQNPPESGATTEQAQQITDNTEAIERIISEKLSVGQLNEAVDDALAQAKASGEFEGASGEDGEDGGYYTPTFSQVDENTIEVSFTASKEGMSAVEEQRITLPVGKDGTDGQPGKDGADGVSVTHEWDGTVLKVTSASGTSSVDLQGNPGKNGIDGAPGSDGADGYTPARGIDYWTESDVAEIESYVDNAVHLGAFSARGSSESLTLPAYTITQVTLDTAIVGTDDHGFTFVNGGVQCPKDGVVLVSGAVYINGSTSDTTMLMGVYVYRGDTEVAGVWEYQHASTSIVTPAALVEVSAGDIIYLKARRSAAGTCAPKGKGTHLDIMYV